MTYFETFRVAPEMKFPAFITELFCSPAQWMKENYSPLFLRFLWWQMAENPITNKLCF